MPNGPRRGASSVGSVESGIFGFRLMGGRGPFAMGVTGGPHPFPE